MNFLKNLLSNTTNKESVLDWIQLIDATQLDKIVKNSNTNTTVIFKHSTRCGISRSVLRKFEKQLDTSINIELYFLDLLKYRELSNEIAHRFNVIHQSPQLLIIKDGKVVEHDSHYDILKIAISEY
jgi:bacillithiol system protein YtxJ